MQHQIRSLVLIGTASLVGLTGCSSWYAHEGKETGRSGSEYGNDRAITHRVHHALRTAPVYKFPDVYANTFQSAVQLSGFVVTEEQKRNAGEIAQATPGVAQVLNDIVVKVPTPTGRTAPPNEAPPPPPASQSQAPPPQQPPPAPQQPPPPREQQPPPPPQQQ